MDFLTFLVFLRLPPNLTGKPPVLPSNADLLPISFGVNGVTVSLVGVGTISNTSQVAIAHRIHRTTQAPEFMFKGSIGLIRIYNTALSSSQVLTNFNANKNTFGL